MFKITCVLVTYNRIEKLKKALNSYENQIVLPERVIVVDNHSTDGTVSFLQDWLKKDTGFEKEVVYLPANVGGSGGFYSGMKKALEKESDWIYVSDDDAYLEKDVIKKIKKYANNVDRRVGAICGRVEENNGLAYYQRRIYKEGLLNLKECDVKDSEYNKNSVELSTYSFVGTAIRTEALWNIGLPNKDFFLWYDDTEHGIRMAKRYKIIMFPDIIIHHDVECTNKAVNWKRYYGYRNNLLALKYNYNLIYFNNKILLFYLSMLRDLIIKKRRPLIKIKKRAIKDAINNKLGISDIYYPGAKI